MMRILLAVTDSPAGLAAARAAIPAARSAIHFAKQSGGQVRAVHVLGEPGVEHRPRRGAPHVEADHQPTSDTASVLGYVTGLGQRAGVPV